MWILWGALALMALALLKHCLSGKKRLSALLYMTLPGLIAFFLVLLTAPYTGITLVSSEFNIAVSAVLGIPGVTGLIIASQFL